MARIVIEFDTDNSAFEDDLNLEISKLLAFAKRRLIEVISDGRFNQVDQKLLDSNGTTVGRVYILVGKRQGCKQLIICYHKLPLVNIVV